MVEPGKSFKIEVLRWMKNAFLNLVFANDRAIVLIFRAEFTEPVLDILLYPESTIGLPWLGPEENFQNESSQMAEKRYFQIGLCKYCIS